MNSPDLFSVSPSLYEGCLLTIILLMRALDPLGYEKETLAHFQKLKVIDRLTLSLTHTHTHFPKPNSTLKTPPLRPL